MLISFFEIISLLKFPLIGLVILFTIFSFYWKKIFYFFNFKEYENIQRVHKNEISRLGGLLIYTFFLVVCLMGYYDNILFVSILLAVFPIFCISVKEDLFHNTAPRVRLILMMFSCLLFFYIYDIKLPQIEFPVIGKYISLFPINIIFFSFSTMVVMNGMNLVDGMNGLFGMTAFFQLLTMLFFSYLVNDHDLAMMIFLFLIPLCVFVIFNYPFGKIFIGDSGAYLYGFINSVLVIYFFGKYEVFLSWLAVLILIYPSMEVLFSFVRKIKSKKSPFNPDKKHLHSIIFQWLLNNTSINSVKANFSTTLILCFLWIYPISTFFITIDNIFYVLSLIVFFVLTYLFIYKNFR